MLITKEVEVGLGAGMGNHYEGKGYKIPRYNRRGKMTIKQGTKIMVNVEDLLDESDVLVEVECDGCGKPLDKIKWIKYKKYVHDDDKYYCEKCSQNMDIEWISFFEWCYLNLSKDLADWILSRWDEELNIDKDGNKITPHDISFSSNGLNNKGYWFKCLAHPEHKSELKSINNFVHKLNNIKCSQCNVIAITHPYSMKYLTNKEDGYKYSYGSSKSISTTCPKCGHIEEKIIANLIKQGFSCENCSDSIPYPEKFFFNFFEQLLGDDFQTQLTKTTLKWCDNYRYDFYTEQLNGIICETHGIQHYEERSGERWGSLKDIQDNDRDKKQLAKVNEIEYYIVIDCRLSNMEWIKNSIMQSELPNLLNFKEEDIDWLKCNEFACSSMVKTVCDLWNSGIENTLKIANKLKISRSTVLVYIKRGVELV